MAMSRLGKFFKISGPGPKWLHVSCKAETSTVNSLKKSLSEELDSIHAAGTYKEERVILGRQGVEISVQGQSGKVLNFCANNYLGLSSHPEVIAASKAALESHGAGLSSVRFICGTQDIHKNLEQQIAKFHNREDAILYACCFDANAGIFEALLSKDDAIISDELNHASLIDGIRLCKAQRFVYKHRDMSDLESKLKSMQLARRRMIATDGVFSMDGNVAPLKAICELADRYKAFVIVDDCHSTGFFGKTGRGTEEYLGVSGKVDIINSTLGKALGGSAGGYTTGPKEVIDMLRQRSRPYLFSNSLPPAVVAASSKALDLIMASSDLTSRVTQNTQSFRSQMEAAGFTIIGENHPICPIMLGDASLATNFANEMLAKGVYVIGFSYPVVPKGKARIRVQISASMSDSNINKTVAAFVEIGKKLKVIQ